MEAGKMDFAAAKRHIGPRPWIIDDVDIWLERLRGPPHKCAAIFIDNSGGDIVLGQPWILDSFVMILCSVNIT